jgi:drug/metabolite transporter (DMT)-like permease
LSPTLVATIAGLTTAVAWGTGDWLSAKSTRALGNVQINMGVSWMNLVVMAGLLTFADITVPPLHQLLAVMTTSLCATVAYLVFVRALRTGPVGIIVPLGNSYPLVTVGLSILILSQTFTAEQVLAMITIVAGAGILAYHKNTRNIPLMELHKDTALALIAAIIWGAGFFALNFVVGKASWQIISFFTELTGFCSAVVLMVVVYRSKVVAAAKETITYPITQIAGVAGAVGFLAIYIGSDRAGSAVIPTVLSGCGPLVASFLGAVVDHEKLGPLRRVGAVLVVIGIIVLNAA